MNGYSSTYMWSIAHGLLSLLLLLMLASCGSVGGSNDTFHPGPFTMTFSLDDSFQGPHGDQPISIALVRSFDGVVVAQESGFVSPVDDPSFIFPTGAVMERGTAYEVHYWIDSNIGGGTPGVCDPIVNDHQWSTEFPNPTNDINFTVSYEPALMEYVCSTFE